LPLLLALQRARVPRWFARKPLDSLLALDSHCGYDANRRRGAELIERLKSYSAHECTSDDECAVDELQRQRRKR
jgi:hypothetical protein